MQVYIYIYLYIDVWYICRYIFRCHDYCVGHKQERKDQPNRYLINESKIINKLNVSRAYFVHILRMYACVRVCVLGCVSVRVSAFGLSVCFVCQFDQELITTSITTFCCCQRSLRLRNHFQKNSLKSTRCHNRWRHRLKRILGQNIYRGIIRG